jgi:hypothetical protein
MHLNCWKICSLHLVVHCVSTCAKASEWSWNSVKTSCSLQNMCCLLWEKSWHLIKSHSTISPALDAKFVTSKTDAVMVSLVYPYSRLCAFCLQRCSTRTLIWLLLLCCFLSSFWWTQRYEILMSCQFFIFMVVLWYPGGMERTCAQQHPTGSERAWSSGDKRSQHWSSWQPPHYVRSKGTRVHCCWDGFSMYVL